MSKDLNSIAVFMFKDSVQSLADVKAEDDDLPDGYVSHSLKAGLADDGITYSGEVYYHIMQPKQSKTEDNIPWMTFINKALDQQKLEFKSFNKFPRGAVLLKVTKDNKSHLFGLTFGMHADTFFKKDRAISDFGIKVAMNICDPKKLKRIQTTSHESITKQIERQLSANSSLGAFALDEDAEHFKSIFGEAKAEFEFIGSFGGKSNIKLTFTEDFPLTWKQLINTCLFLAERNHSDEYKKHFSSYDRYRFETDPETISKLDDIVAERIKAKTYQNIHLAVPDFFDYDRYSLCYEENKDKVTLHNDLRIEQLSFSLIRREGFNIDSLKRKKIYQYDHDLDNVYPTPWSVYRCLVAEVELDGKIYVLSDQKWKYVSKEFYDEVTDYLQQVAVNYNHGFPADINIYDEESGKNNENVFNRYVAENLIDIICFDRSKFEIAGEKKYEFCDLLAKDKRFIHVKRYSSGSSSIGHLFTQGKFYGDAFLSDTKCRGHIRKYLSDEGLTDYLDLIPEERPTNDNDYTVVFCILSDAGAMTELNHLPFMARYDLMQAHQYLTKDRAFKVEVWFVPIQTGAQEAVDDEDN